MLGGVVFGLMVLGITGGESEGKHLEIQQNYRYFRWRKFAI